MSMQPAPTQGSVLLIEDHAATRELISIVLRRAGYDVIAAGDGSEGLERFNARRPDLVLLDVYMPGVSGWEVLEQVRERSDIPIVILTGASDETSKVRGLNSGADDYVVKPTGAAELVARVGAVLRRARAVPDMTSGSVYDDGLVKVDFDSRHVEVGGAPVSLTPLEYRLLSAFARHPGVILSRDDLLRQVWRDESGGPSDHVKIYVGYLRRKLSAVLGDEDLIETVRGFGYRWLRVPVGYQGAGAGWRAVS